MKAKETAIKISFTTKDLESISGVKSHTLRMWEKRYRLLKPKRDLNNFRSYGLGDLKKLLKTTLLLKKGYKISQISSMESQELAELIIETHTEKDYFQSQFKLSLFDFNRSLFNSTYVELRKTQDFQNVFLNYFKPLFKEIGELWLVDIVTEAQEHFFTQLVREKILEEYIKIERRIQKKSDYQQIVLFLPENELHELGIMFLHYEFLKQGLNSIYLGYSIPMNALKTFINSEEKTLFITQFTNYPEKIRKEKYLQEFNEQLLQEENTLWILDRNLKGGIKENNIRYMKDYKCILDELNI